jgi:DNA-binding CsgD family transcriptional regulator
MSNFDKKLREITPHKMRVAFWISQGLSNTEIAKRMGLQRSTIAGTIKNLRAELGFDGTRINFMFALLRAFA